VAGPGPGIPLEVIGAWLRLRLWPWLRAPVHALRLCGQGLALPVDPKGHVYWQEMAEMIACIIHILRNAVHLN
jgi:hypothetical protein